MATFAELHKRCGGVARAIRRGPMPLSAIRTGFAIDRVAASLVRCVGVRSIT
jgi:hypothetical protein